MIPETTMARWRWSMIAPGYDLVVSFARQRRRALRQLELQAGERLLIPGCGTGLDLEYVPPGVEVVAIDLTPAMIARARRRAGTGVVCRIGDAQRLDEPDASFDAVVLHLILAIVPDPAAVLAEAWRVLRPGGRISVFDKFLPDGAVPSWPRRLANVVTRTVATHINRRLADILDASATPLRVEWTEHAGWGGFLRIALLRE